MRLVRQQCVGLHDNDLAETLISRAALPRATALGDGGLIDGIEHERIWVRT
jgi:hypothetical protein